MISPPRKWQKLNSKWQKKQVRGKVKIGRKEKGEEGTKIQEKEVEI